MVAIPKNKVLKHYLELPSEEEELRPYIGMSQIGHECDRYLYMYKHKMFKEVFTARQRRIFERGDLEEERVIRDLTSIPGIYIEAAQTTFTDFEDQFRGHCDGFIEGIPTAEKTVHVLEVKTMADKYFKKFIKEGMEKAHYSYYIQGQMYMGYSGHHRILWSVTNKDNEDRDYERGYYNKKIFDTFRDRAKRIINLTEIPDRIGTGPEYYVCRWCHAKSECFNL